MKRLLIGLDIDGVIVDYATAMLPLLSEVCHRPVSIEEICCYDLQEALDIDEETNEYIWGQTLGTELLIDALPIEDAIDGLSRISRHEIWIITHRPLSLRNLTERWLGKRQVKYDNIIFVENSDKMSAGPMFDVFVEDYLEEALIFADAGVLTLLFNQPWNQTPSLPRNCRRVHTWEEVVLTVIGLENEIKEVE